MEYVIKNASDKDRHCEGNIIKSGEELVTKDEKYVINARMSPNIFEVEEKKENVKLEKKTYKGDMNGSK